MPSFKLYKLNKNIDIIELFHRTWIDDVRINDGDLEVINQKIDTTRQEIRNLRIARNSELSELAYTFQYEFDFKATKENHFWLPDNLNILQSHPYLLVSKGKSQLRFLIKQHLRNNYELLPIEFKNKSLLAVWRRLKKSFFEKNHNIQLHRIILERVYIESDFIKELNISTGNIEELGLYTDLMKNSERIKVITFKILWDGFKENYKNMTVRIDYSGNILIYGDHSKETINEFLSCCSDALE